jgi:nucleoside-diphosphate-sugar epimerase
VKDFARLIRLVLEAPREKVAFEVFNAGGDANNMTKQGIVEVIREFLPAASVKYQEHGSDPRNYRVDFRKVRRVLDFEPEYSVEYGVRELLAMIQQHVFDRADRMRNFHGNYEVTYP